MELGFDCGTRNPEIRNSHIPCGRSVNDPTYGFGSFRVSIDQDRQGRVVSIEATVEMVDQPSMVPAARGLWTYVAAVVYTGAQPEVAARWVERYAPEVLVPGYLGRRFVEPPPLPKETVIAGVRFRLAPGYSPTVADMLITGAA
jgi:hypothetical protein